MKVIIHAPNVHQGGGRTLLLSLLSELLPGSVAILDERLTLDERLPANVRVLRVKRTLVARLAAEYRLRLLVDAGDTIVSFGNLPPLFRVQARVVLFLQNRYMFSTTPLRGFPHHVRLRIVVERMWLAWRIRRAHVVMVQTPSMQRHVLCVFGISARLLPFYRRGVHYSRFACTHDPSRQIRRYDFIYVASGEPHKNHSTLIEAWKLLAVEGLRPSLCLTIAGDQFPGLIATLQRASADYDLNIENIGALPFKDLQRLYGQGTAVIYPSLMESLGLPLIEARIAGLSLVAAERDYVRDVVDPEETFDPLSAISIARAVKRFLGRREPPLPLVSPAEFLRQVVKD